MAVKNAAKMRLEEATPLLEVCEKGAECRSLVDASLDELIKAEWIKTFELMQKQVLTAKSETERIVRAGWDKKVQCEVDFPCCTYGEEYTSNVKNMMITARGKVARYYDHWWAKELKRRELVAECGIPVVCANEGPCWNGEPRRDDDDCSCPPLVLPECPAVDCWDGHPVDENCACRDPNKCYEVIPEADETLARTRCEYAWEQVQEKTPGGEWESDSMYTWLHV